MQYRLGERAPVYGGLAYAVWFFIAMFAFDSVWEARGEPVPFWLRMVVIWAGVYVVTRVFFSTIPARDG